MDKIIELIKKFFDNQDWNYTYDEEKKVFISGINMGNILGNVRLSIIVIDNHYSVYTIFNNMADKNSIANVAEYLHRANYGLRNGNFELDFNDGEVRYKVHVNCDGIDVSEQIIFESIFVGVSMIEKYGIYLLKLMLGIGNPQEYIDDIENHPEP